MAGRPRRDTPAKGPQIVDTAFRLFIDQGYRDVTMEMIAVAAGMSKQTLYRYFDNKQALFGQVVREVVARSPVATRLPEADEPGDLRTSLSRLVEQIAASLNDSSAVGMFRMVISEAGRHPELGRHFYDEITAVAAQPLSRLLDEARGAGLVELQDPWTAALDLIAILKEHILWPQLLGRTVELPAQEVRRIAAGLVAKCLG